jgi:hypothetical protein
MKQICCYTVAYRVGEGQAVQLTGKTFRIDTDEQFQQEMKAYTEQLHGWWEGQNITVLNQLFHVLTPDDLSHLLELQDDQP